MNDLAKGNLHLFQAESKAKTKKINDSSTLAIKELAALMPEP